MRLAEGWKVRKGLARRYEHGQLVEATTLDPGWIVHPYFGPLPGVEILRKTSVPVRQLSDFFP